MNQVALPITPARLRSLRRKRGFCAALPALVILAGCVDWTHTAWVAGALCMLLGLALVYERTSRMVERAFVAEATPAIVHSLDFRASGIPNEGRTVLAVPTMLTDVARLAKVLATLERNLLIANDSNVVAALLTDLADAERPESTEGERRLMELVAAGVGSLNSRFGRSCVVWLHRERTWSVTQRAWIGHERKRGKIEALTKLVVTGATEAFTHIGGPVDVLRPARFILCMDEDTFLTAEAVQDLVGVLMHPAHRPELDEATNSLVSGHASAIGGLFPDPLSAAPWRLGTFMTGTRPASGPHPGMTRSALFELTGQGNYPGKGLFDAHMAWRLLHQRLPLERVLSHDTLEGLLLRPVHVSRVALLEGFPGDYAALCERRHRWARGDWQNALLWTAGGLSRRFGRARAVGSLVIGDQIRVTTEPVIAAAFGAAAMFVDERFAAALFAWLIAVMLSPAANQLVINIRLSRMRSDALHLKRKIIVFSLKAARAQLVQLTLVPQSAALMIDAIARTLWRWCRGQRLLDWQSSLDIETKLKHRCARGTLAGLVVAVTPWFVSRTLYAHVTVSGAVLGLLGLLGPVTAQALVRRAPAARLEGVKPV